jgi:hypothetical protein
LAKGKSQSKNLKLIIIRTINDDSSNDIIKVVPSLTDMEFSWIENY